MSTTNPQQPDNELWSLLAAMKARGVEFVIVSLAFQKTAEGVRGDVDLIVRPTKDNAAKALDAAASVAKPVAPTSPTAADLIGRPVRFRTATPQADVDLLPFLEDLSFDQAWAAHKDVQDGPEVWPFVDREAVGAEAGHWDEALKHIHAALAKETVG